MHLGWAILVGVGLGGLFDGIVLHQILQWHHMLSAPTPPVTVDALRLNTLADGLFHAAAWIATATGLAWLVVSSRRDFLPDPVRLLGGILLGWGGFNVTEGIIDHHVLGIHHVREGPDALLYDVAFLAWGAGMLLLGLALTSRQARAADGRPSAGRGARQ